MLETLEAFWSYPEKVKFKKDFQQVGPGFDKFRLSVLDLIIPLTPHGFLSHLEFSHLSLLLKTILHSKCSHRVLHFDSECNHFILQLAAASKIAKASWIKIRQKSCK